MSNKLNILKSIFPNNQVIDAIEKVIYSPRKSKKIERICVVLLMIMAFIAGGLNFESATMNIIGRMIIVILAIIYSVLDSLNIK